MIEFSYSHDESTMDGIAIESESAHRGRYLLCRHIVQKHVRVLLPTVRGNELSLGKSYSY